MADIDKTAQSETEEMKDLVAVVLVQQEVLDIKKRMQQLSETLLEATTPDERQGRFIRVVELTEIVFQSIDRAENTLNKVEDRLNKISRKKETEKG